MLDGIRAARAMAAGAEVTLEANPDDVTPAAADAWRRAGVNRISLGAQSFDRAVLQWMHRTHTAEQVAVAVETIRGAGIGEVSLDLIFGLPAVARAGLGPRPHPRIRARARPSLALRAHRRNRIPRSAAGRSGAR